MSDSSRPPISVEARRRTVEQALLQLARTMDQLETAVSAFPPDFDPAAFARLASGPGRDPGRPQDGGV